MSTPYRVPILDKFEWQGPVITKSLSSPPAGVKGNRYIVKATGSGAWAGQTNAITYYNGSTWVFVTPTEGYTAWVLDEDTYYYWSGSAWQTFSNLPNTVDEFYVEVMG